MAASFTNSAFLQPRARVVLMDLARSGKVVWLAPSQLQVCVLMRSLHSHRTNVRRRFCSSASSGSQPSASFQADSQILGAGVGCLVIVGSVSSRQAASSCAVAW